MLLLILFSFGFALVTIPFVIKIAKRYHLVDRPKGMDLKIHKDPIPNIGGVVIFISICISYTLAYVFIPHVTSGNTFIQILCFFILLLGILDDQLNINPFIRFIAHIIVAFTVALSGAKMQLFPIESLNILAAVFLIVAMINAVNLLDGMDGLATGVTAVSSLAFLGFSFLQSNIPIMVLSLALVGSLLGFLPYNFHPAKIFLGDCGSTLIGFLLAVSVISLSSSRESWLYFVSSLIVLGLPIVDTSLAILRRIKNKKRLFEGDREHFYDKLLRKGLSQRQTAFISYGIALIYAGTAFSVILIFG